MLDLRKFKSKTVEAEIKAVVRAQRARAGESRTEKQIAKWTAEGAVKGRKGNTRLSILRRGGIRQLPGICRYSAKSMGQTMKQGGTAGEEMILVLDRKSVMGEFFVRKR